jgi:hypothetical protein
LNGWDSRARINDARRIPDPPCLSTFKGGGVRNRGRTSPTAQISVPGSTTMKTIPDPPCLSTFKRRGGGPESRTQLPDGHDRGAQINGARAASSFSAVLCLTSVGPSPLPSHLPFPPPIAAMCRRSSHSHSSTWPLFFASSSTYHPPRVLVPPRQLPTKSRPLSSFCTPRHSHHALIVRCHHSCHAPLPPNWPPCPSFKPFSVPGGSTRGLPHPEELSWPDRPQSQKAVIEAVGGG